MPEQSHKSRPSTRTSTRPQGVRMSKRQRKIAQDTFLASYKLNANKTLACMQANIDPNTVRYWEEHDETFSFRLEQADIAANDMLLGAAWQRAVKGVERIKVSMGKPVYVDGKMIIEREYSDTVLLRLMSWRIPGFRESANLNVILPKEYVDFDPSKEGSEP